MPSLPPILRTYLAGYIARRRRIALVRAVGIAIVFLLTWMLLWCFVDRMLPLAGWVRFVLLVIGVAGAGSLLVRPIWAALSRRIDWVAAAEEVEARNPAFAERLLTVTSQLAGPHAYRGSPQLIDHLLEQVEAEVKRDDPNRLVDRRGAVRAWMGAGCGMVLMVALLFVAWLDLPRLMLRFTAPLAAVPPATTTRIAVSHSPDQLIQGQPLVIRATATQLDDAALRLHLATDSRHFSIRPMTSAGDAFTYTLNAVDRDLQYRVSGGDAITPVRTVRVLRRPTVLEYRIRYEYPSYINRQPLVVTSPDGTIEAPVGTLAALSIISSEPLRDATLTIGDDILPTEASAEPHVRHATLRIERDAIYRVSLLSQRGAAGEGVGAMRIGAIPDRPPIVRLIEPASDLRLTPRDVLAVRYQAFDDYGITGLRLIVRVNGEDRLTAPLRLRGDPARQEAVVDVDLAGLRVSYGDLVRLRVEAEDGMGHPAASQWRAVLVSPRSIDMNTHLRIAELREARARARMMSDALASARQSFAAMENAGMIDPWGIAPDYDRALTTATEQAMLIRQGLLRVIVRSPSAERSTLLGAMTDAAHQVASTSDTVMLTAAAVDWRDANQALEQALQHAGQLHDTLVEMAEGEQAAALLAEQANLTALGDSDHGALSDAALESYKRARDDFAAGVIGLGFDPDAADLDRPLQQKVDQLAQREATAQDIDYNDAARQWAAWPTAPLARENFAMRLEAAAQTEAVRPDADLVRAHDLHLASRAAVALTVRIAISGDEAVTTEIEQYPDALAAMQAAHRVQRRGQDVRPLAELTSLHSAAEAARDQMRRWAGVSFLEDAPLIARTRNDDATAVMQANAATALREYDRAVAIDQQLASIAADPLDAQSASNASADAVTDQGWRRHSPADLPGLRLARLEPVERAVEQARRIDEIAVEQSDVAQQTHRRQIEQADALQQRQEQIAAAIDDVERDASVFASGNPREQALAALQAAREHLTAMPQALAAVQEAAEQHNLADDAFRQAAQTRDATPRDQRAAASRRAAAAEAARHDARIRLRATAQEVHPDVGEAIAQQLQPYIPETDATVTAIEQTLTAALRQLHQAVDASDGAAVKRAVADARAAIHEVQAELRAAQDALSAQDPLVAARWFARQAAADLALRPPDFASAEQNQQEVSAALDRAWRNSVHQAARGRMAGSRAFGSLYAIDLPITAEGGVMAESGLNLPAAIERAWGWLRPMESVPITTTRRDADPPGYQEALRAYFEALGSVGDEKEGE